MVREAIDLYREHGEHIALVLLDVRMPGLDGPKTLEALRKLNPEVPACFMTDNTGDYEPQELLQRGATYVITKPFLSRRPGEHHPAVGTWRVHRSSPVRQGMPRVNRA